MSAIGPGDWVECIRGVPEGRFAPLAVGAIYQVREVRDSMHSNGGMVPTVLLVGIVNRIARTGREYAYEMARFRPIYSPKADFIEGLLKPIEAPAEPEKVSA